MSNEWFRGYDDGRNGFASVSQSEEYRMGFVAAMQELREDWEDAYANEF